MGRHWPAITADQSWEKSSRCHPYVVEREKKAGPWRAPLDQVSLQALPQRSGDIRTEIAAIQETFLTKLCSSRRRQPGNDGAAAAAAEGSGRGFRVFEVRGRLLRVANTIEAVRG